MAAMTLREDHRIAHERVTSAEAESRRREICCGFADTNWTQRVPFASELTRRILRSMHPRPHDEMRADSRC